MKKRIIFCLPISAVLLSGIFVAALAKNNAPVKVEGYSTSTLPTTIDLNDTSAANIRSYYSSLNSLATNQRQGTNLLKNLKTILKNGQKYYSYDSGNAIWQIYEIADRDWDKSPASSTTYGTYNSSTNKITNYTYGTGSGSSAKNNPYIHALYINRDVTNQTTAWDNHNQDQWGINREHVWPKAEGFETSGAGGARGDPMHLMAGNGYANNIHSNYYYGYVKTSSSYTDCGSKYSNQSGNLRGTSKTLNTGTVFEPQDCDKGDIARAIFYMVARYNYLSGSDSDGIDSNNPNLELTQSISDWASSGYSSTTSKTGKMGILTDLLNWHHQDPVDEYEIHRNNLLYTNYTNNRNPFIDFPEWVDFIWGTATYNGTTYDSYSSTPTGYATPSSDTINGYNGGSSDPVSVTGVTLEKETTSIEVGASEVLSYNVTPFNATDQSVTWTSSNANVATVSSSGRVEGVAEGNATITVKTNDGNFTDTCTVTVTPASSGGEGTEEDSVAAASGALPGWTASGTGSAYVDGSVKLDGSGDNVYKTDIFSAEVAAGMTSLTVTINSKINGTPNASNSYRIDALDSSGNVLTSVTRTGADVVTSSYGDTVFTIDSDLTGCTGFKITYATKGAGNWGIKSVSWSATYTSGESEITVSSIAVKTAPTKLTYTAGDGFAPAGLVITVTYSDSSTADVSYSDDPDSFDFDPADNLQTSDTSVTISYGGKTCTQAITVNASKTLSSITINTDNVTKSFYVDDTFEHDNLVVTAHFSDSSSDVVSSSATVTTPDMSTAGEKTVTVSYTYGGTTKTAQYTITVIEGGGSQTGSFTWNLSIASYNTPTSTELVTWSSSCATLTAERASGKTAANNYLGGDSNARTSSRFYTGNTMRFVPASNYEITSVVFTASLGTYATALSGSTWTNATAAVSNTSIVTITPTNGSNEFYCVHTGQTGGTSIVVNYSYTPPAALSSITLDTTNVQTVFAVNDTFNYTGLVVTAHYSDSTSATVTPSSVSSPNMSTTGQKTVTVTYEENDVSKSATYNITVSAIATLNWTAPTINVFSGTTLTSTAANSWGVTYNNGSGSTTYPTYGQFSVILGGSTISLPYIWQPGDDGKTLAVSYNSLTTSSTTVSIVQSLNAINKEVPGEDATSDLTFAAACGGSGTADDGKAWTVTSDGTESTFDSNKGIHYGTSGAAVQYIKLTSTAFTAGTITKVVVQASTASGVSATVSVKVGGVAFGGDAQSLTTSNASYTFEGEASAGTIEVLITKPSSATKAIYCKGIAVTYATQSVVSNIANVAGHEDAQRAVVKFAKAFNAAMDTTSGCTTNLYSAWSTATAAWNTFLSEAAALGETEEAYAKDLIKNASAQWTDGTDSNYQYCLERCLATYDKCVNVHGQTAFMNGVRAAAKIPYINPLTIVTNNGSGVAAIIIVAVVSVAALGGYFFLRKKKED